MTERTAFVCKDRKNKGYKGHTNGNIIEKNECPHVAKSAKVKPKSVVRTYYVEKRLFGKHFACFRASAVNLIVLKIPTKTVSVNRLTFSGLQNMPFCTTIPALLPGN